MTPIRLFLLRLAAVVLLAWAAIVAFVVNPAAALGVLVVGSASLAWGSRSLSQRHVLGLYTQLSDVIIPETWIPYSVQRSVELSELVSAGIVDIDPQFSALADAEGNTVNMPFFNDLTGEDEILSDQNPLTTGKIDSSQDAAVNNNRGRAWKHNDLARIFSGADPARAAADLVGGYWARRTQAVILNVLKGIFSTAGMSSHLHSVNITAPGDIEVENTLTGLTWIDATQRLGDAKSTLTAAIMHSAVEASLRKQDLIVDVPPSEGKAAISTFQGKRIIIDDGMPVDVVGGANRYTTYLFGAGAIAWGNSNKFAQDRPQGAAPGSTWGVEFFREALAGNSGMITRRRFIVHPRGVKWLGASVAGPTPTNAEFATAANWLRVWDPKKIGIVAVQHNIAA